MEAQYKAKNGQLIFKLEEDTTSDLFESLASIEEVFDSHQSCGICQSPYIHRVRTDREENKYFELVCTNPECRAKFEFGQNKKGGGLFPKYKDKDGKWIPNRGWVKYVKPADTRAA